MKILTTEKVITYRIAIAAAISLVTFIVLYATKMPFLTDNFILSDDLIYIPKWLIEGFSLNDQGIKVFAKFLSIIFVLFQEPGLMRIAFIFTFSLAIGIFSYALSYEFSAITVTLFALLSALIQMGVNQAVFILGSYPMLGVALILIAFSFIYLSSHYKEKALVLMISGYLFVTLVQFVHPVFIVVPFSFLVLSPLFNKKHAIINIVCVAVSYVPRVALTLMPANTYHYSKMKGWTVYSVDHIINQAVKGITYVWSAININGQILVVLLFCAGFAFLMISIKKNKHSRVNINKEVIALFFLVLGALTFFPTTILSHLTSRYFYAPQMFCLMSLMIFTAAMARRGYGKLFVNTLLALLCVSFYMNAKEFHKNRFAVLQHTQTAIKNCLENQYVPAASSNDQVIVFLNRYPSFFTGAYNHWSTWFLRYQTGNKNLIGLVGTKSLCSANPIVEQYKDHNEEYWDIKIVNGKEYSYRIMMKGIEKNRNTFAFEQTKEGFAPIPFLVIPSKSGLFHIAEFGKPFRMVSSEDLAFQEAVSVGFSWPVKELKAVPLKINKSSTPKYDASYMTFNGDRFISDNVTIPNTPTVLVFETILRSNEIMYSNSPKYNKSQPPMPLLAYPLAIYQTSKNNYSFGIIHKKGGKYINYKFNQDQWLKVVFSFDLVNKSLYCFVNDTLYEIVRNIDIDIAQIKSITLGKGYLQRFWKGHVGYFKIYEITDDEKKYYLNISQ